MTRTKHVFVQDTGPLGYMALGDASIRALTIYHMIRVFHLDALIIPPKHRDLLPLWRRVFADKLQEDGIIPPEYVCARISKITPKDWQYGNAAWTVCEAVMWENAFFETRNLRIETPNIFPCDIKSGAVMIYPAEKTDGNRVLDSRFWIDACREFRAKGYKIHHLGDKRQTTLAEFYGATTFDQEYPPTIDGLSRCIASSSLAFGGNTGPTWACLMSSIPQIVIETKRSPHGYWNFDRVMPIMSKQVTIVTHSSAAISKLIK